MRGDGDSGVGALLDVLLVEFGNEGSLDCGATRGELGGVEGRDRGGRSVDGGCCGEELCKARGDLGGVGGATREDDLGLGLIFHVPKENSGEQSGPYLVNV